MNTEEAANIILETLNGQAKIYDQVFIIAQNQLEAFEKSNEIELMELIAAKDVLMQKANEVSDDFLQAKSYWDLHFESADESLRLAMRDRVNEISEVIGKVLKIDDQVKSFMENLQKTKSENNRQKSNIRKIKSAYGQSGVSSKDNFIDKNK